MNEAISFSVVRGFSNTQPTPHSKKIASLPLAMTDLIASLLAHWAYSV
ncbi:MAG: hypothetical protein WBD99_10515 [Thermodesulfobacteriota bacterium]